MNRAKNKSLYLIPYKSLCLNILGLSANPVSRWSLVIQQLFFIVLIVCQKIFTLTFTCGKDHIPWDQLVIHDRELRQLNSGHPSHCAVSTFPVELNVICGVPICTKKTNTSQIFRNGLSWRVNLIKHRLTLKVSKNGKNGWIKLIKNPECKIKI